MPPPVFEFSTGPSILKDEGVLSYNLCLFGPLLETKVTGNVIKDNAKRAVKYIEYTIVVDGYVTLPAGEDTIGPTMASLYKLLTAQGGYLVYAGKALDLVVNKPSEKLKVGVLVSPNDDVAWGPIPEVLEFQPLGAGRSAKIVWKVTVRLPALSVSSVHNSLGLLQLNYETSLTYSEDGFSSLSIKGTIEIPMTRKPQSSRIVPATADDVRVLLEERILTGIDLGKFKITKRNFNVSRDKRTLEWDVEAEERPYMDLPPDCTIAGGSYNVRPAKAGPGLASWLCTLRATYTVRADKTRKTAWWAFLALLRLRMSQANLTPIPDGGKAPPPPGRVEIKRGEGLFGVPSREEIERAKKVAEISKRAWLIDFSFDEGTYKDSKTISFSATWRMTSWFSHILLASGLWKKVPEGKRKLIPGGVLRPDNNIWAVTMKDIMGTKSWLPNNLDPNLDVIVDFGSTGV